ncbi:helix-turn-helix domain-containing protein [Mycolicibacterium smegmatis]|uniref:helix-turn-helix domain-containing protein n=1 Tax=Mycolicibacterium smegmatis TaxID=1772 RepID=UPI00071AF71F|nr:helix-turn-helix domain-containing protein [Mycolicibacterium smegmatis]MDF1903322.1 helix-turn-helix domain-containing protein [Mycolicibacterium smegmatis]MDF1909845.1 helix-turn-helix domain-containing protein [Mycolicibacterium smegmatis]MDF1921786.1 helix-turn-helix domain-containing protein [Mycolicibacterium smegmatis]MDF1928233.1 helix-turn-helix domain-containing protein [Mycolicibacterium smegmatis]UAK53462.1 helix-turn-helix domain-containing protein [Mycolicibacterium smegmatis]
MQIKTMGDVGALVRSARTARGMTQADLAQRLRISRDWVVRLEKGHPRLEAQRVIDALRVAGVSLEATVADTQGSGPRKRVRKTSVQKPAPTSKAPDPFDALFGTSQD